MVFPVTTKGASPMPTNEKDPEDVELAAYRALERIATATEKIARVLAQLPEHEGALLVTISGNVRTQGSR